MAKLAILGHATRGKEVIEILEMLGGKNKRNLKGTDTNLVYYINSEGNIDTLYSASSKHYKIFTLGEFLEKFPYKVGDKVIAYAEGCLASFTIQNMRWNSELDKVEYKICSSWIDASLIMQRYKEMEENFGECIEKTVQEYLFGKKETTGERKYADLRLDVDQDDKLATEVTIDGDKITPPENYLIGKITKVDNGMLVEFVKKQPKYPKTYEECCNAIGCDAKMVLGTMPVRYNILVKLEKLLVCRDAYWKIAGKEMGLGKPWEPDWNKSGQLKYALICMENNIIKYAYAAINAILAFPTEEMRDAFYENFKDLIEECKQFL